MSKLIFIVGLTATGKTSLALQLAAEAITGGLFTGADIVSADSRQVFEGLKIVSGADVPEGFKSQIPSTKSQENSPKRGKYSPRHSTRLFLNTNYPLLKTPKYILPKIWQTGKYIFKIKSELRNYPPLKHRQP